MLNFWGNQNILNQYKVGFLCSRKVPANILLKTYDWAVEQREKGICIVSGFHSKVEKDVFEILCRGNQSIILVLARGLMSKWNKEILKLIDENRLLVISPFDKKVTRPTNETATKRNQLIAEISDKLYIPYFTPGGKLEILRNKYLHKLIT